MYKVVKNTSVGYDKNYILSECTQSELKKLFQDLPNLRETYITLIENEPKQKRTNNKSKSVQQSKD